MEEKPVAVYTNFPHGSPTRGIPPKGTLILKAVIILVFVRNEKLKESPPALAKRREYASRASLTNRSHRE
jgi:hypothetical protein